MDRLPGSGSFEQRRDAARRQLETWRAKLSVPAQAERPHHLLLGWRGIFRGVAVFRFADQAGAHRVGRAHVRDRRHQDAADLEGIAVRGCTSQGGADRTARQGGVGYLRWPGILRSLLPGGGCCAHPVVREERRCAVVAPDQSMVAGSGRYRWAPAAWPCRRVAGDCRDRRCLGGCAAARSAALRHCRRALFAGVLRSIGARASPRRAPVPLHRQPEQAHQRSRRAARGGQAPGAGRVQGAIGAGWRIGDASPNLARCSLIPSRPRTPTSIRAPAPASKKVC